MSTKDIISLLLKHTEQIAALQAINNTSDLTLQAELQGINNRLALIETSIVNDRAQRESDAKELSAAFADATKLTIAKPVLKLL